MLPARKTCKKFQLSLGTVAAAQPSMFCLPTLRQLLPRLVLAIEDSGADSAATCASIQHRLAGLSSRHSRDRGPLRQLLKAMGMSSASGKKHSSRTNLPVLPPQEPWSDAGETCIPCSESTTQPSQMTGSFQVHSRIAQRENQRNESFTDSCCAHCLHCSSTDERYCRAVHGAKTAAWIHLAAFCLLSSTKVLGSGIRKDSNSPVPELCPPWEAAKRHLGMQIQICRVPTTIATPMPGKQHHMLRSFASCLGKSAGPLHNSTRDLLDSSRTAGQRRTSYEKGRSIQASMTKRPSGEGATPQYMRASANGCTSPVDTCDSVSGNPSMCMRVCAVHGTDAQLQIIERRLPCSHQPRAWCLS